MPALEILSTVTGLVPTIWDTISRIQNLRINKDGILIAYRYEVNANRALIGELKLEKLKESSIGDSSFRNFIENLQTQIGAVILYDTNRRFYKDFAKSLRGIKAPVAYEPESDNDVPGPAETIFDAMRFSVNKIEHLKRLVSCAREGPEGEGLFHEFRLKKRVENIKASLDAINDGIKDLAV